MNTPIAKMNAQEKAREKAQKKFAADGSCTRSPPDRTKPDAEGERRRHVIGIRPIVDWPIVVVGTVVRTIVAVMTIVAPDIAVCAEIGGVGCAGALRLRLWRRGSDIDCTRPADCERACNKRCPDQALHDGLLSLISTSEITGSNLAGFKANLRIETGPQ